MRDSVRVLVLGTGQMGSGIIRLVLDKQGLEFAGAFARRASRAGLEVGQAIGLERLFDEVVGAAADRGDGGLNRSVS